MPATPPEHSRAAARPVAPAPLWQAGWYAPARRCPSPNVGERPAGVAVDLLVIHSISLPPGEYGGDAVPRLFSNTLDWDAHPYFQQIRGLQVSAHFFIRRDGALWQFASTQARAWHAGASSHQGRANCNDFSVGIELEGLEGHMFEAVQYAALAALCRAIGTQHPIRAVAGHEHIAPGRKQDPGPGFDWPRLRRLTGRPGWQFP
ncbi:MAG: 1,6-anhydro-N-acetylmuramyl-L-alanine amidase AmpD [Comamonadaceae bacterium]|nr:1,6-anhydro-N-acetylmuramyl-L-alanine amidase AmpD [Comamonadaceae bacterium]